MIQLDKKTINYTMTSVIDGKEVVSYSMAAESDGTMMPVAQSIINNELYVDNINEVNKDLMTMQTQCFADQAEIMKQVTRVNTIDKEE
ncbi:hypothetical protein [Latilactobacillus fuchuensis]|uniref:hypothetical protein n=1 Tax=Latilactobacillus fuchuensis TaxID=164393 RepID=UPI0039B0FCBD